MTGQTFFSILMLFDQMLNVAAFVFVQTEVCNMHPEAASGSRKEHHLAPGVVILINRLNCHTISCQLIGGEEKSKFPSFVQPKMRTFS